MLLVMTLHCIDIPHKFYTSNLSRFGKNITTYNCLYSLSVTVRECPINAPGYMRGTLLFLLTKNRPCYCIFVNLFQIIVNYVISDAINMITLITTRKNLGETHIMLPWRILVYNIVCINQVEFSVFITEKG